MIQCPAWFWRGVQPQGWRKCHRKSAYIHPLYTGIRPGVLDFLKAFISNELCQRLPITMLHSTKFQYLTDIGTLLFTAETVNIAHAFKRWRNTNKTCLRLIRWYFWTYSKTYRPFILIEVSYSEQKYLKSLFGLYPSIASDTPRSCAYGHVPVLEAFLLASCGGREGPAQMIGKADCWRTTLSCWDTYHIW